jgi:hypothetical protein
MNMQRIGVVTAGGNAPGMNAAIRSVVRTALFNGLEIMGVERGYTGLIEGKMRSLDIRSVSGIINRGARALLYIFLLAPQIVDDLLVLSAFSYDVCKRDWRYSYRSKYRGFAASFFFASKQRMISRWFSAHEPGLGLFPFALTFVICQSFRARILFSSRTICDHPPGDFYP